ncbi:beta-galactosidase trimerization domain-containing protein [Klebsiella pneumoniae]|nr:beta-galactosidase trimerization domain-containing protein [Klebsiella pneumoniae]
MRRQRRPPGDHLTGIGIVHESDLCYLGGFPGLLRNLLGIWAEEIDRSNDGEFNLVQGLAGNQCGLQGPYQGAPSLRTDPYRERPGAGHLSG